MVQMLVSSFVRAWVLGLIALLVGRYVGGAGKRLPESIGHWIVIFLKVWGVTFLAEVAFSAVGLKLGLPEHYQSGLAEFLLPIAAGSYYAHRLLRQVVAP